MSIVTMREFGNMGRLGNQLFQLSAIIGYSLDNNKNYILPRWEYQDFIPIKTGHHDIDGKLISEESIRYAPLPKSDGNVILHGHFLSHKYFNRHTGKIRQILTLNEKWCKYINCKFSHIVNRDDTCSIHVRRGDYLHPEQQNCQGVLELNYYEKAKQIMGDKKYVIFSDDIAWCRDNIDGEYIDGELDIIDMFLMSLCKNHIIANSTFSWWGAWLNKSANHVIAPRQWFKNTIPINEGWGDHIYLDDWDVI